MAVHLNRALVDKLQSISQDIKTYLNINYHDPEQVEGIPELSEEELAELLEIRNKIKSLYYRLKERV